LHLRDSGCHLTLREKSGELREPGRHPQGERAGTRPNIHDCRGNSRGMALAGPTPSQRPRRRGRERTAIMLTHTFSYEECLHTSLRVAWKEEDVLKNRDFDYSRRFLPNRLAGVDEIGCLDATEKLKLNQIIGNAYCHIFAFVEEFIVPQVLEEAQRDI
jgi:hypothetical protein